MMCLHRGNFHAPLLQEYGNWVCALHSPRSMGMDSHGKVEYPMADDDTWLPPDANVLTRERLPMASTNSLSMKQTRLPTGLGGSSRTGILPFAAESRHYGYACWANSRRFAIVARSAQQCAIIAEVMHAYNLLGNRIEVYAPRQKELLSWTMPESIVRYMKTIGPVLTFVHPKSAVMQSLGGSPTALVKRIECST